MSSHIYQRSCPTLAQRAQLLVHLGQPSTPLPATASLQPLASPWSYQKTSRGNCSPTEAFAKPAGRDKPADSDKTYLLTRLHLLNKDKQQSVSTRAKFLLSGKRLLHRILSEYFSVILTSQKLHSFISPAHSPQFPFS